MLKVFLCSIFSKNRVFLVHGNENFLLFSVKSLDNDCLPRC